jgi:thioredoxin reductase
MTMTVDVVVVGTGESALDAAIQSARNGKRVLLIARTRGRELRRRIQQARTAAGASLSKRISVLAEAEVECVAGIRSVEVVLARYVRTGRRVDINTAALLTFEAEPHSETADQPKELSDVRCSGC